MNLYKQKGENLKYPEKIEIWKRDDKVPEWLSDRAKVININEKGEIQIAIVDWKNSFDIISNSGNEKLVQTKTKDSIICFDSINNNIFSLTQKQFNLLYKEI